MSKQTYTVTGSQPFDLRQPGEVFEADLDPFIEQWALEQGLISKGKVKPKGEKEGSDA